MLEFLYLILECLGSNSENWYKSFILGHILTNFVQKYDEIRAKLWIKNLWGWFGIGFSFFKKKAEMSANLSGCFMKKMSAIGKNERRRIILRHTYFFQFLGGGTHI